MPTITAIDRQKRTRRVDLQLDGAEAFSLRLDLLQASGLVVGDELTASRRRELEAEDQRLGALEAALRLVAMGPRSEQDLRERLSRRRGFRREAVDAAVTRLRELGYVDDGAFARHWVESRLSATPRSRRALAFELNRRGVGRDQVDAALDGVSDAKAAYEAAQRRLRALQGLDRATFERRLGNFLASRGFGYGVARATIARCWSELTSEAGEEGA